MTYAQQNYLRTFRRKSYLSQEELSNLLGCKTGQIISRYECNVRVPNLRTVFTLMIIFGVKAEELFPGLYSEVKEEILRQIQVHLKKATNCYPTPKTTRKHSFLLEVINSLNEPV